MDSRGWWASFDHLLAWGRGACAGLRNASLDTTYTYSLAHARALHLHLCLRLVLACLRAIAYTRTLLLHLYSFLARMYIRTRIRMCVAFAPVRAYCISKQHLQFACTRASPPSSSPPEPDILLHLTIANTPRVPYPVVAQHLCESLWKFIVSRVLGF